MWYFSHYRTPRALALGSLDCHEVWEFSDVDRVQKLAGYRILCKKCDSVHHLGRIPSKVIEQEGIPHIQEVTKLGREEMERLIEEVGKEWVKRSKHEWKIDVSYELGIGSNSIS